MDVEYYGSKAKVTEVAGYKFGLEVMRLARLVLIAEYLDEWEPAAEARTAIKRILEPWLNGSNSNPIVYDSVFGGLITDLNIPGLIENSYLWRYDNHHHVYGYLVYAAAVLGKNDTAFLNQYEE